MTKQGKGLLNNSTLTSEEGGHDVTLWQQLARSDGIPWARIVDASCKVHSMESGLSHNGRIGFSTKLKPSDQSKLVVMAHLAG